MTKFVIIGDCNGCEYYVVWRGKANEWAGLQDNATKFKSKQDAIDVKKILFRKSKLPLTIKSVK